MLEKCAVQDETKNVVRLASVAGPSTRDALVRLGIDPDAVDDIVSLFSLLRLSLSPQDIVDDSFRARSGTSQPFGIGRFGDGTIGVYYSALDESTCCMELEYHLSVDLVHKSASFLPYERVYSLIYCRYSGETADLRGHEKDQPELVSLEDDGYPFCQSLALQAVKTGIAGFLTVSARHGRGTCAPIFSHASLSEPKVRSTVRAIVSKSGVSFR